MCGPYLRGVFLSGWEMSTLLGGSLCAAYGTGISFMHLYGILYGIEMPDRNGQWYQHLLTLFDIFLQEQYRRD